MKTLLTLILTAAGFALIFMVARPLYDDINSSRVEQIAVEDTLARLTELQKLRDDLLNVYNSIPRDRIQRLSEMLPSDPEIGTLLVTMEKLTGDQKLALSGINFSTGGGADALGVTPILYSFSVSTSYSDFKTFLGSIEKNLRLIDLSTISFSAPGKQPANFSLQAKSYYKK